MNVTTITLDSPHLSDFAEARNRALARATTDWVLFVDQDETVTPALKREIALATQSSRFAAYALRREDSFLGRTLQYGETGRARFLRLARRDFGHWVRPVHECWVGQGRVGKLANPLLHTPAPTLAGFVAKINRYSTLDANFRHEQGQTSSLWHLCCYPLAKFIHNYCLRLGFLDGVPGLIHAILMSWHSYLTWSKLYLLCKKT